MAYIFLYVLLSISRALYCAEGPIEDQYDDFDREYYHDQRYRSDPDYQVDCYIEENSPKSPKEETILQQQLDGLIQQDLEQKLAALETALQRGRPVRNPLCGSYFTPNILPIVLQCIHNEQEGIKGAMYRFTHGDPARALVERKATGVHTCLVLDQGFNKEICGALRFLLKNGIELFSCEKRADGQLDEHSNMHHKFLLFKKNTFGKPLLITGSCNYTYQGFFKNHEDYYVIDDKETIEKFKNQYERVRSFSRPIALAECSSEKDANSKSYYSKRNNNVLGL